MMIPLAASTTPRTTWSTLVTDPRILALYKRHERLLAEAAVKRAIAKDQRARALRNDDQARAAEAECRAIIIAIAEIEGHDNV